MLMPLHTDLLTLAKYFLSNNNKLLRNLEEEGDKGKDRGLFHKSHIIIEYNIA